MDSGAFVRYKSRTIFLLLIISQSQIGVNNKVSDGKLALRNVGKHAIRQKIYTRSGKITAVTLKRGGSIKQVIYIDVLVCSNMLIDYFLLYAAALLTGRRISRVRLCIAAMLGGISSCKIFLPPINGLADAVIAVCIASAMTAAAFGFCNVITFFKTTGALLAVTMCYGGFMTALWVFAAPQGLHINNGVVYIDIPPLLLIVCTTVCYAVITLFSRYIRGRNLARSRCSVSVKANARTVCFDAIVDTGNLLCEPFSGIPVIVAEREVMQPVLSDEFIGLLDGNTIDSCENTGEKVRVIPYSGINGDGVMLAFFPEDICIEIGDRKYKGVRACIGVLNSAGVGADFKAIVNPDVI